MIRTQLRSRKELARDVRDLMGEVDIVSVDSALDDVLDRCRLGGHTSLSEFLSDLDATIKIHNHKLQKEFTR